MAVIQSPIGLVEFFQATLSSRATNVTGDGTNYRILFDTTDTDTTNGYNAGTGVYTVARSGFYVVFTEVGFGDVTDPSFNEYLIDITAGTDQSQDAGNPYVQVNPSGILVKTVSGLYYLTAGQTVDVDVRVSGGAKTVDVEGGATFCVGLVREFT